MMVGAKLSPPFVFYFSLSGWSWDSELNQIIHTSAQDMEGGAGEEPPPLYQIGGVAIAAATRRKKHAEARKDKDFLAIIIPYSSVSFHENPCFCRIFVQCVSLSINILKAHAVDNRLSFDSAD